MTSARAAAEAGGHAARFAEIWCADFEFRADPGEHPWPVCMVAQELKTGKVIRLWRDELLTLRLPPSMSALGLSSWLTSRVPSSVVF